MRLCILTIRSACRNFVAFAETLLGSLSSWKAAVWIFLGCNYSKSNSKLLKHVRICSHAFRCLIWHSWRQFSVRQRNSKLESLGSYLSAAILLRHTYSHIFTGFAESHSCRNVAQQNGRFRHQFQAAVLHPLSSGCCLVAAILTFRCPGSVRNLDKKRPLTQHLHQRYFCRLVLEKLHFQIMQWYNIQTPTSTM